MKAKLLSVFDCKSYAVNCHAHLVSRLKIRRLGSGGHFSLERFDYFAF
jgi:hypothetical protein